jgi:hypothetical protein
MRTFIDSMKTKLAAIILLFAFNSFAQSKTANDSLFTMVSTKLKNDEKSFQVFQALHKEYKIDNEMKNRGLDSFQTVFITFYNQGIPLTRLIKEDAFKKMFKRMSKKAIQLKSNEFRRSYQQLISNYANYNADDNDPIQPGGKEYFLKFLNGYFILPLTDQSEPK